MAITINWPTGVINIPRTDLTLKQSVPTEIRELNLNEFRLKLKELEASEEGATWLKTHLHNTEVSLGGLVFARVIEILSPYTVTFEDGQYSVDLVGANSNVGDKINPNQVSVRSYNSAGLISNAQIEYASFNGGVTVDTSSAWSGTLFPIGTPQKPVNNLDDARLIAIYRGFTKIYVIGDIIIDNSLDFTEFSFDGTSYLNSIVNIQADANVYKCAFKNLEVTGVLDGNNELNSCITNNLNYVNGHLHNCGIKGNIVLSGGADAVINNCNTIDPYDPPIIDMGVTGQNLVLANYTGLVTIKNLNDNQFVGIGLDAGSVTLDSTSVLQGTIQIVGIGTVHDENNIPIKSGYWNGGVYIINETMSETTISRAVWDAPLTQHVTNGTFGADLATVADIANLSTVSGISADIDYLKTMADSSYTLLEFIRDLESGKQVLVNNQLICYKPDNTTELIRFNLFGSTGTPTTDNVYRRDRV